MNTPSRNALIGTVCVLVIGISALWIYRGYKAPEVRNVELHRHIGKVLAQHTAGLVGKKGKITFITIPTAGEPELAIQLRAFREALKNLGDYDLKEEELDPKGQAKYGLGNGLSGRRFVRAVNKNQGADAIVSFIGAPELANEEISELKKTPKFLAETRSPDHLPKLFEKKLLELAVVSRFTFPAPGPLKPTTPKEWFDKHYQVVTPDLAPALFRQE